VNKKTVSLLFITGLLTALITCNGAADPLPLTRAEMTKLHHFFPTDEGSEHLSWKGDPILIELPLNQEKRIIFPAHVTFDAKGALTTDQLRVINNDQSLYLTALKPINTTRVYVTLQDSNEVVMMDLSTADKANSVTTTIDIQQNNNAPSITTHTVNAGRSATASLNAPNAQATPDSPVSDNDVYVTLTRFAWQQLYAPERLLVNPAGITRAPMHTDALRSDLVYGDKVIAHPLASWLYQGHYLTAVQLRNKYDHAARLQLSRDLCGNWETVSAYPRTTLKAAGNKTGDSTTLFLISAKPFGETLEDCHVAA
jgi:integrating conjugative element protein (TIGR03749 family)